MAESNKNSNFAENTDKYEGRNQRNGRPAQRNRQAENGGLLNDALSKISRRSENLHQVEGQRERSEEYLDRRNREDEKTLEKFAKEQSKWIDEVDAHFEKLYGEKIGSGAESTVYLKDGNTAIKSRSLTGYNTIQEALESIAIHNKLFPETAMRVVGFGRSEGEFIVMLEQPFIKGRNATNEEIGQFISSTFSAEKDASVVGNTSYKNPLYLLQDLEPKNVIVKYNAEGNPEFYVIDGDFYKNPEHQQLKEPVAKASAPTQEFRTSQGELYGFVDSKGNIYVEEHKIKPEHLMHEYVHLWGRAVMKYTPAIWKRGVMKRTSL